MTKPTIVIIAGGKNSRFAPLNTHTHKGFLSLLGKPLILDALENLKKHGFTKVVLVVSPKDYGEIGFSAYCNQNKLPVQVTIVLQERPTGMGDALLLAREHLGDSYILASPYYANLGEIAEKLVTEQKTTLAKCVVSATKTDTPELYGILELDAKNSKKALGIIEKPTTEQLTPNMLHNNSPLKVDSVYLLNKAFLNQLAQTKSTEYAFEEAFSQYCKHSFVTWILNTDSLQSLKYPWHLFSLFQQRIKQHRTTIASSAHIAKTAVLDDSNGAIIIRKNARIGDFSKLIGPVFVGEGAIIGDYSFVRDTTIEANSIIGANTEVARSIIFENTSLHNGYLADSILGQNTKIGAGLITANKRLDRASIQVAVGEQLVDAETNSLGIITGENAQLGVHVTTMPGMTIGANATVFPSVTVTRSVPTNATLKK